MSWFRKTKPKEPTAAEQMAQLREQLFSTAPRQLSLDRQTLNRNVWGAVAEWNWGTNITLFALADRTVSLYTAQGFGVIGGGQHESVWKVGLELLEEAEARAELALPTRTHVMPFPGTVRFTFLTFDGPLSVDAAETDLQSADGSPLSHYFATFQLLLAAVRSISG